MKTEHELQDHIDTLYPCARMISSAQINLEYFKLYTDQQPQIQRSIENLRSDCLNICEQLTKNLQLQEKFTDYRSEHKTHNTDQILQLLVYVYENYSTSLSMLHKILLKFNKLRKVNPNTQKLASET